MGSCCQLDVFASVCVRIFAVCGSRNATDSFAFLSHRESEQSLLLSAD